jgi:photosystem II stability/assembly factor-like uncharacterized protein
MKNLFKVILILFLAYSEVNAQWVIQYSSSPAQTISSLRFFDSNTGYHTSSLFNGSTLNIYKTTNGGVNYVAQNSSYTSQRFMAIYMTHPDTVFISGNYGKILRTFNGGQNWVTVNSDTLIQYWGLWFVNSSTGFAAGSSGKVIKTTNRGDNWTVQNSGVIGQLDGIYFLNESTGYIGGSNAIIKTTDGGANWSTLTGIFVSFETATCMYFSDTNNGMYGTNAGRIAKTTNGGLNWTEVYMNSGTAVWGLSFANSQTGYGCTSDGKVIKTTDGGTSWGIQNTPLTENLYEIHFPSAMTGYVGTWSGKILKTTNGGLTFANNNSTNLPQSVPLHQNFPNPFNPATTISFTLPSERTVEIITVFDASGKKVTRILNNNLGAGEHSINWNAGDLPGGVYFARLTAGDQTITRTMILLK